MSQIPMISYDAWAICCRAEIASSSVIIIGLKCDCVSYLFSLLRNLRTRILHGYSGFFLAASKLKYIRNIVGFLCRHSIFSSAWVNIRIYIFGLENHLLESLILILITIKSGPFHHSGLSSPFSCYLMKHFKWLTLIGQINKLCTFHGWIHSIYRRVGSWPFRSSWLQ